MLCLSEAFPGVYETTVDVAGFSITEGPNLYAPFCWLIFHVLAKANPSFELNTNIYLYTEKYPKIQGKYFTGIMASSMVI